MTYAHLAYRKAVVAHVITHLEQTFMQPSRPDRTLESDDLPKADSEVPRESIADFIMVLQHESSLLEMRMLEARAKEATAHTKLLGEDSTQPKEGTNE